MRINSNIFTAITILSTRTFVILSSFFFHLLFYLLHRVHITSSVKHYEPLKNANIKKCTHKKRERIIYFLKIGMKITFASHESCLMQSFLEYSTACFSLELFLRRVVSCEFKKMKFHSSVDSLQYSTLCHVGSQLRIKWVKENNESTNNQLNCSYWKKKSYDSKQISRHSIVIQFSICWSFFLLLLSLSFSLRRCKHNLTRSFINLLFPSIPYDLISIIIVLQTDCCTFE